MSDDKQMIFETLGIAPNEPFVFDNDRTAVYMIRENLLVYKMGNDGYWFYSGSPTISYVMNNFEHIEKAQVPMGILAEDVMRKDLLFSDPDIIDKTPENMMREALLSSDPNIIDKGYCSAIFIMDKTVEKQNTNEK